MRHESEDRLEVDAPWAPDRRALTAVAIAVAAGIALRFAALSASSLWHDEGATLYLATATDPVAALRGSRHPPLSIYALRGWIRMFGEGDSSIRSLSATVSSLSLIFFALFSRNVFARNKSVAPWVAAVALYAVAPFPVYYASEATPYAFLEFGSLVSLWAASAAIGGPVRWTALAGIFFGVAIAFGSQYMGFLAGVAVAGMAGLALLRKQITTRTFYLCVGTALAAGLVWLPWIVGVLPDQQKTIWGNETKLSVRDLTELPPRLLFVDLSVLPEAWNWIAYVLGSIVWAALVLFGWRCVRGRAAESPLLWSAIAAPVSAMAILLCVMPPNFMPRYLTSVAPAVACAVIAGLVAAPHAAWRLAAVGVLVAGGCGITILQKMSNRREDYRSACDEIVARWRPGDRIVVITGTPDPFAEAPVRHYLRERPDMLQATAHLSDVLSAIPKRLPPGTRVHVVHREKLYSETQFAAIQHKSETLELTPLRFGVRRALLVMK